MEKVKKSEQNNANKFHIVGNNICLDFINTLVAANGKPLELLANFADLTSWAVAAKLLEPEHAEKFLNNWSGERESEETFKAALHFRELLRETVLALKGDDPIKPKILTAINRMLQNQNGTVEVRKTENGFEKSFHVALNAPQELIVPIAESAADLLCYANPAFIKKCEAADCVLYFYDATKNHSRRWCSMRACGNRAKAAAFYERKKLKEKTNASRKQTDLS